MFVPAICGFTGFVFIFARTILQNFLSFLLIILELTPSVNFFIQFFSSLYSTKYTFSCWVSSFCCYGFYSWRTMCDIKYFMVQIRDPWIGVDIMLIHPSICIFSVHRPSLFGFVWLINIILLWEFIIEHREIIFGLIVNRLDCYMGFKIF